MLVKGKLLPGVTVLITSRPTAERAFEMLKFARTVEILGFFEEQIKEYVNKFCDNHSHSAEQILNKIDTSLELRSLCYIPINTYIVCLTLKESFKRNEEDIPKTITELYNRAVKILLWKHHPLCKSQKIPRPNDYLIVPLPSQLENDMNQIKTVAMRGIEEGSLIFEKASTSDFHELANCGLFHQIPHKTRSIYCFLHLTIQEFLSAMFVAENLQDIGKFLDDHSADPKWHLVIQFIAGLLGQVKRLGNIRDREITEDIERRYNVLKFIFL